MESDATKPGYRRLRPALGYSRVGITTADSFPSYIEELKARYEMYAWYIEGPSRPIPGADPKSIMPSAKSMVVVIYDGFKESFPEKSMGKMGRLYQTGCYLIPPSLHQWGSASAYAGILG